MGPVDEILARRADAAGIGDVGLVAECDHALARAGYSAPETVVGAAPERAVPPAPRRYRPPPKETP